MINYEAFISNKCLIIIKIRDVETVKKKKKKELNVEKKLLSSTCAVILGIYVIWLIIYI